RGELRPRRHDGVGDVPRVADGHPRRHRSLRRLRRLRGRPLRPRLRRAARARPAHRGRATRDADPPDAGGRPRAREHRPAGLRPRAAARAQRARPVHRLARPRVRGRGAPHRVRRGRGAHAAALALPLPHRCRPLDPRRLPQALAQGAGALLAARADLAVPPGGTLRPARPVRWLWPAAVLLLAALPLFPSLFGSYAVTLFTLIFFYGFLGQAWNIVGGFAGQLSAGHAAFLGIGAYTAALLSVEKGITPWVGMFVGGALAAALGTLIGFLGFRFGLRGFYFVLLTVAFAEICRII